PKRPFVMIQKVKQLPKQNYPNQFRPNPQISNQNHNPHTFQKINSHLSSYWNLNSGKNCLLRFSL
ncbi:hypothetical protein S245_037522, partial [Arachis hypogaea]